MLPGTDRWLETLLAERFGHCWHIERQARVSLLQLEGADGSIVFDRSESMCAVPDAQKLPSTWWDAEREGWSSAMGSALPAPAVASLPSPLIERRGGSHFVRYDILGLCEWALGRIEEIGRTDLDPHGRFPATASHAYQHGYLDRPVVDEWLAVLGQVIQRQWPTIVLRRHKFELRVSHDVDAVSLYPFGSPVGFLSAIAKDLLRARNLGYALRAPWIRLSSRRRLHPAESANTFEWIMDQSERRGLKSAFYFMSGRTDSNNDADYDLDHPAVRDLIGRVHERGHEIGVHPSYGTYLRPEAIVREAERLRRVSLALGVQQERWGGRMHFLRWRHPTTLIGWENAGMDYDSTLGYADRPGFRCGTCFEYPGFDPVAGRSLRVRIRPLIAMECSVIARRYMALGTGEDALEQFVQLLRACRRVGGVFTLLWHNTMLIDSKERALYQRILESAD